MDDLIQEAQNGNDDAFVALFERSRPTLWRAAMAVLGNPEDAADALQETVIKTWRALPQFQGRSGIETWFMRTLLRTSFDLLKKRRRETPYDPLAQSGSERVATDGAPRDRAVLQPDDVRVIVGGRRMPDREEALDVWRALERLSPDDRVVLAMFYVDDFPTKKIAHVLNLSEGAVRARLTRARCKFKEAYGGENRGKAEVAR